MYPPYVSLLVLRRFPAFFLPRLPPFFGLPFFVGLAFFGLPAISKCLTQYERNNRGAPPIYTLGVRKKRIEMTVRIERSSRTSVSIRSDLVRSINSAQVARVQFPFIHLLSSTCTSVLCLSNKEDGFTSWQPDQSGESAKKSCQG